MSADTPRLSVIPGWVILHPALKGKDLQVLCTLGLNANRRHGWTRRSQVKIAEQLGCARSTVQASIARLVEIGAVERREVISDNGRDSAHWYRVVYDAPPPEGYDFDAYLDDEDKEFGPIDEASEIDPPAGIPAPPAGPESAPPADPRPAPMLNTSCLTPPAEQARESAARELSGEEKRKIERSFRKWWPMWPTMISDGEGNARQAWFALSDEEREACLAKTPAYVAAVKGLGRTKFCAASTYLADRMWERLDDPKSDVAPPSLFNPFSRAWMALRLSELSKPMRREGWPALSQFQTAQSRDADRARQIQRERMARYGWPKVTDMHEKAGRRVGSLVPGPLVGLSEGFVKMHRDSDELAAWKALHERMGWPWLPEPTPEWLWLPEGEPEAAMAELQAKLNEATGRGISDDAA